ncbi:hypothetical protein BGW80DRAFT_1466750 [Lactifluus volemus]|nr:hypothetical protein BGW80DRAFT_1466750 [Lactifluus volemus]
MTPVSAKFFGPFTDHQTASTGIHPGRSGLLAGRLSVVPPICMAANAVFTASIFFGVETYRWWAKRQFDDPTSAQEAKKHHAMWKKATDTETVPPLPLARNK